jgi:hypothetical protein
VIRDYETSTVTCTHDYSAAGSYSNAGKAYKHILVAVLNWVSQTASGDGRHHGESAYI